MATHRIRTEPPPEASPLADLTPYADAIVNGFLTYVQQGGNGPFYNHVRRPSPHYQKLIDELWPEKKEPEPDPRRC